jgi:hypothetical protein
MQINVAYKVPVYLQYWYDDYDVVSPVAKVLGFVFQASSVGCCSEKVDAVETAEARLQRDHD